VAGERTPDEIDQVLDLAPPALRPGADIRFPRLASLAPRDRPRLVGAQLRCGDRGSFVDFQTQIDDAVESGDADTARACVVAARKFVAPEARDALLRELGVGDGTKAPDAEALRRLSAWTNVAIEHWDFDGARGVWAPRAR
jgi:hypothetical protein